MPEKIFMADFPMFDATHVLVFAGLMFLASGDHGLWGDKAVRLRELHHFYIGVALYLFAWHLRNAWLGWAGTVIATDDAWQHTVQTMGRRPEYESALHHAYGWLWVRIAPLRWLDALLNRIIRAL